MQPMKGRLSSSKLKRRNICSCGSCGDSATVAKKYSSSMYLPRSLHHSYQGEPSPSISGPLNRTVMYLLNKYQNYDYRDQYK